MKFVLPAWLAVIEQVPAVTSVTVAPATVQTPDVVDAKLTGRPELLVALRATGPEPSAALPSGPNVIDCVPAVTLKVCVTGTAAV